MTEERKVALRILAHQIDNMSYWEEQKEYYTNEDVDAYKVNEEVFKIMRQVIERYGLNRSFV
jgi:predicted AAA+ superfamily ATPase